MVAGYATQRIQYQTGERQCGRCVCVRFAAGTVAAAKAIADSQPLPVPYSESPSLLCSGGCSEQLQLPVTLNERVYAKSERSASFLKVSRGLPAASPSARAPDLF